MDQSFEKIKSCIFYYHGYYYRESLKLSLTFVCPYSYAFISFKQFDLFFASIFKPTFKHDEDKQSKNRFVFGLIKTKKRTWRSKIAIPKKE